MIVQVRMIVLLLVVTATLAFSQSEPEDVQYSIYSTFLRAQLDDKRGTDDLLVGRGELVISARFEAFPSKLTSTQLDGIKAQVPEIQDETLRSFAKCSSESFRFKKKFNLPTDYGLAPPASIHGEHGYLQFSCVGLNDAATQALFFVSRLNCKCAVTEWVLMEKTGKNEWLIARQKVPWISEPAKD
jgi:hypothetical protein